MEQWTPIVEQEIPLLVAFRPHQAAEKIAIVLALMPAEEAQQYLAYLKTVPAMSLLETVLSSVQKMPLTRRLRIYHQWGKLKGEEHTPVVAPRATPPSPPPVTTDTASPSQPTHQPFSSLFRNVATFVQNVVHQPQDTTTAHHVNVSMDQKVFFRDNGYLILQDIVDETLTAKALAAINKQLGKGTPSSGPEAEAFRLVRGGLGYWPEIAHTPAILDLLYKSPLISYVKALVGNVQHCNSGQIALRFPGHSCLHPDDHSDIATILSLGKKVNQLFGRTPGPGEQQAEEHPFQTEYIVPTGWKNSWHIDGVPNAVLSAMNIMAKDSVMQFTMLVGVILSDVSHPFAGNLAVFPGSHKVIQDHINHYQVDPKLLMSTSSSADSPVPPIQFQHDIVQITGKRGDVVLCHYQLAHTVAPNASENIRYAIYFRVHHAQRQQGQYRPEAMKDIWLEYDGIRPISVAPQVPPRVPYDI